MIHSRAMLCLSALLAPALALGGCVFESAPVVVPEPTGTLTVDVTIESGRDTTACSTHRATSLELVVYDTDGSVVTKELAPCEDLAISVDLYEGRYTADVTLVDSANQAATLTLPVRPFSIVRNTELVIDVDFPTGSFL